MISTRGRYALRVMIDLAECGSDEYTALKDVADRQGISKKYLEIIVKDLVSSRFIKGARGKSGGYKLTRKPEEYTVQEILDATEGDLASVVCLTKGAEDCPRAPICKTLPMWKEYDELTRDFFSHKHLSDLI